MVKCHKCGKVLSAPSEEEAKEMLKAHDEEMHEGRYQAECEKRSV
jgi:uncharacterized protein with PIN domain